MRIKGKCTVRCMVIITVKGRVKSMVRNTGKVIVMCIERITVKGKLKGMVRITGRGTVRGMVIIRVEYS